MPRLIDADEIKLPQGFFEKVDNVPKFYKWLDEQPTVDAEPTEEQVKEYCRKRCLVIVSSELFNEMKARWSATQKSIGNALEALDEVREEEPEINPCRGCEDYDGEGGCLSHGGCGERRDDETD